MKKILVILLFPVFGCNNASNNISSIDTNAVNSQAYEDSFQARIKRAPLSNIDESIPVKILSQSLIEVEYSNRRNVRLKYKNTGKKKISAIKFAWEGINSFGDPADMDTALPGYGGGFTDDELFSRS